MILYTNYILYVLFALAILGIERTSTFRIAMQLENIYKFMIGAILVTFANPMRKYPLTFETTRIFSWFILIASSSITGLILHWTTTASGTSLPL